MAIVWTGSAAGRAFASFIDPVGAIWVNALRMTVIPLVVSLLIATLASGDGAATFGRLGVRAIVWFLVFLVVMGIVGVVLGPPVYAMLHVDAASSSALRAGAGGFSTTALPGFGAWVASLVPAN